MSHKHKILVVDDDPTVIRLLESILSNKDYEVLSARDGLAAMALVKLHKPQLIVLDIVMPGINGYDVCRNLKFDSPYSDIPILLLTFRDQEIDSRISQMMGISYMQKPVDRDAFLNKVAQILR